MYLITPIMSSDKNTKANDFLKSIDLESLKNLKPEKKGKGSSIGSIIGVLGAIINIIWVLSLLLNPPIDPQQFINIGCLGLIFTFFSRLFFSIASSNDFSEFQSGGSIGGYVVSWIIVQFYSNKEALVSFFGYSNTVNEFLNIFIVIAFLLWVAVPTTFKGNQEIIFNLPPIFSYLLLNFWKISIIILFVTKIWNINEYTGYITALLLVICLIEIIGMYQSLFKIDITEIILDLPQIIREIVKGPFVSLKWVLVILSLILLNFIRSDVYVLLVLGFAILMSLISFTTFISRLTIDSGLIQRKAASATDSAKTIVPQIFSDIKELKPEDIHENYYQVLENFTVRKKTKVEKYSKGNFLFRLPLKDTIEALSGIYIAKLSIREKKIKKNGKKQQSDFQFKSIGKFDQKEWNNVLQTGKIEPVQSDVMINQMGFENKEEFDNKLNTGLKQFSKFQDGVRDRIRGVPATAEQGQIYDTSAVPLPEDIKKDLIANGVNKLEVIPGKDEFLFYIKKKS